MEVEPIANISANDTFDPDEDYYSNRQNLMGIFIVLVGSAAIVADFIITYVIIKTKELHTRTNIYVANLCICNIFYLLFTPLILNLFSAAHKVHAKIICFSDEIFFLFMLGNYIFICILLLDWYVVTYKSLNSAARCRASYKLVIASVWTVLLVFMVTTSLECTAGISLFPFIAALAILFYFCSFIFAAFICVMKIINEKTTSVVETKVNLELHYVISYFLCWFPNWLFLFLATFFRFMYGSVLFGLLTFVFGYTYALVLLRIMYKKDMKFRAALRKLLFNIEVEMSDENASKGDDHFASLI